MTHNIPLTPENLPQVLRDLMEAKSIGQKELSNRAGVSPGTIFSWIHEISTPGLAALCWVLAVLGKRLVIVDMKKEDKHGQT